MKKLLFIGLLLISAVAIPDVLHVDANGVKLKEFYLSLNVEHLWIAGQHINWETGVADNPDAIHNVKTHCSSFVAAACKKLDIYILRPPQHKQGLLANAQYDWLATTEAANEGWKQITGSELYQSAQNYANEGYVVVAVCKNPDEQKPGHAALVMPAEISSEMLAESGPQIIMAGTENHNNISLKAGFKHHLTGWPENAIVFYYNEKKVFGG